MLGGAMNALAGGGTFATLPALIALGLPANIANATSNVALLPGGVASVWAFRDEIGPVGGIAPRLLIAITLVSAIVGCVLLVMTPTRMFDVLIPWLLLFATLVLAFGRRAAAWLHERVTIGTRTLIAAQTALSVYGGYFGGGLGLMTTAVYGLLAGVDPRGMFAQRTLILAISGVAALIVFVATGLVDWASAIPMLLGAIVGGWVGARLGLLLSANLVRVWTLIVSVGTTIVFFWRAYG
ncbi:sulfite exporter TauE/SafE family protein [Hephaestia sp. GCM10023244]|uniref:sulfite exporter TauE/SafE family protein n=1 Tax=unclassified Hephaestia TaxID=2631281 RepID=UPI002076FFC9|nr:sulfite exporter TauE/SafE family protein [Hephaestia sp. MAHUQ-44]MCM8729688.1 sulfite exporter TauE/SafE family protein [Hephaestia sp. MAHUQ-44]